MCGVCVANLVSGMLIARIGRRLFGVDFVILEADSTDSGHRSFPFRAEGVYIS
jgi:hypothetical protein